MIKRIWTAITSPGGGAVLAILGVLIGAYFAVYYERQGELVIRIDSMSRVFDVHRPVGGLEITYAGENLRSSKRTLWALTATIQNRGNAAVRKSDFDEAVPLGFEVAGAVAAEQPQLTSPVPYLATNVRATFKGSNVFLTPAVFEAGDSVQLTVLLLGSEANTPKIIPLGKVAGQRQIELVEALEEAKGSPDFVERLIPGSSFPIRALRWISWAILIMLGLFAISLVSAGSVALLFEAGDRLMRLRRTARVKQLTKGQPVTDLQRQVMAAYVTRGASGLSKVEDCIRAARELQAKYLPHLVGFKDDAERELFLKEYGPSDQYFLNTVGKQLGLVPWLASPDGVDAVAAEMTWLANSLGIDVKPGRMRARLAQALRESV